MSEPVDTQFQPGETVRSASDFIREDANLRRFRYHLLRLTVTELHREEIDDLCLLGSAASRDDDHGVSKYVDAIRSRPDASALARAIADIASSIDSNQFREASIVGAVYGAYASVAIGSSTALRSGDAVAAAIGGAIAAAGREYANRFAPAETPSKYYDSDE
jgi:hypothetical protein